MTANGCFSGSDRSSSSHRSESSVYCVLSWCAPRGGRRQRRGALPEPCTNDAGHLKERHLFDDFCGAGKGNNSYTSGVQCRAPTFFTIDNCEHAKDLTALGANGVNRLERGTSSRDRVLDDDNAVTRTKGAFDQLACSVRFRFLPDGECAERHSGERARVRHCAG